MLKLSKLLFAVPFPCSTRALVAPLAVLPIASPVSVEPVCNVSVFAPVPANSTEAIVPEIAPALVTVALLAELLLMKTPKPVPEIVPPELFVTLPP